MNETAPTENQPENADRIFEEHVQLGKRISPTEAFKIIAEFHGTDEDVTRGAFFNLSQAEETDVVVFDNSTNNDSTCLKMQIFNEDGTVTGSSLINARTGQPINHIS